MANNKREDGRYQKNIIVGRKANGSYIRKTVYGKTKKELDLKIGRNYATNPSGHLCPRRQNHLWRDVRNLADTIQPYCQ